MQRLHRHPLLNAVFKARNPSPLLPHRSCLLGEFRRALQPLTHAITEQPPVLVEGSVLKLPKQAVHASSVLAALRKQEKVKI